MYAKHRTDFYRTTLLFFLIQTLLLSLCSCNSNSSDEYTPRVSYEDNFQEKYYVNDPNLIFIQANDWERPIYKTPVESTTPWHTLKYATIPETNPEDFVATYRADWFPVGGYYNEVYAVYQGNNAPNPCEDWTISNVQVVEVNYSAPVEDSVGSKNCYKTYYQALLNEATPFYNWNEQGSLSILIEELQSSWNASLIERKETKHQMLDGVHYFCVYFEENPNIIWWAELLVADDGYYLGRINDVWQRNDEINELYPLGENWNQLLKEILQDAE